MQFIVLKYGAVQYGVVQYGAVHYSAVQYGAVKYGAVQYSAVHYGAVQYGEISDNQCIAVHFSSLQCRRQTKQDPGADSSLVSFSSH